MLIAALLFSYTLSHSQATNDAPHFKHSLSVSVAGLFGSEVELNYQNFARSTRYSIGGSLSYSERDEQLNRYGRWSAGFSLRPKFYPMGNLNKQNERTNLYFGVEGRYRFIGYEALVNQWQPFEESGILYYRPVDVTAKPNSHLLAFVPQVGVEAAVSILYIDASIGLNYYKEFRSEKGASASVFDDNFLGVKSLFALRLAVGLLFE